MLQEYCKLVTLGTMGMLGCTNLKWYYQLVENFHVYLQAKNQFHSQQFSGDIAYVHRWTDRQTDRQTDKGGFIDPSIG